MIPAQALAFMAWMPNHFRPKVRAKVTPVQISVCCIHWQYFLHIISSDKFLAYVSSVIICVLFPLATTMPLHYAMRSLSGAYFTVFAVELNCIISLWSIWCYCNCTCTMVHSKYLFVQRWFVFEKWRQYLVYFRSICTWYVTCNFKRLNKCCKKGSILFINVTLSCSLIDINLLLNCEV